MFELPHTQHLQYVRFTIKLNISSEMSTTHVFNPSNYSMYLTCLVDQS